MNQTISPQRKRFKRPPSPIDAERARIRALPAVRLLADLFDMPIATALATAEAMGLHTGADR